MNGIRNVDPELTTIRLVDRLLTQIERVQTVNDLNELTPEVVEAARQALLIGH